MLSLLSQPKYLNFISEDTTEGISDLSHTVDLNGINVSANNAAAHKSSSPHICGVIDALLPVLHPTSSSILASCQLSYFGI